MLGFGRLDARNNIDMLPTGASCGLGVKKKTRKPRTIFTPYQIERLTSRYEQSSYLTLTERADLAAELDLTQTQVSDLPSFWILFHH